MARTAPTARERARAEITQEIIEAGRRQLAEVGAQQLSLRAVAREVGMVSSAVYRYFPSRDDLLTRLIVDAYGALADHAEAAEQVVARTRYRERWMAATAAVREWAVKNPHEYALVYGSPVPGYQAPEATIEPASRVAGVLLRPIREAAQGDLLSAPGVSPSGRKGLARDLRSQLQTVAEAVAPELPPDVLVRVIMAWTHLFGIISFELFGHLVGSMDPADPFFEHAMEQYADYMGLPARSQRR
jgi:AcrR family transcriptional regulator